MKSELITLALLIGFVNIASGLRCYVCSANSLGSGDRGCNDTSLSGSSNLIRECGNGQSHIYCLSLRGSKGTTNVETIERRCMMTSTGINPKCETTTMQGWVGAVRQCTCSTDACVDDGNGSGIILLSVPLFLLTLLSQKLFG